MEIVDVNKLEFSLGGGTAAAIFIVRQLQEQYLRKLRKLYLVFVWIVPVIMYCMRS